MHARLDDWLRWRQRRVDLLRRGKKGVSALERERERVLRTAGLCCSPTPPSRHCTETQNGQLRWVPIRVKRSRAVSRRQVPDPRLCMRLRLFSLCTFIHHVHIWMHFYSVGEWGAWEIVSLVPVPPHAEVKQQNGTLARELDLRSGALDENKCFTECAARC